MLKSTHCAVWMTLPAAVTYYERAQSVGRIRFSLPQGSHHHRTGGLGCDIIPWPHQMLKTLPALSSAQTSTKSSKAPINVGNQAVFTNCSLGKLTSTASTWFNTIPKQQKGGWNKPGSHQGRRCFGDHWVLSCSLQTTTPCSQYGKRRQTDPKGTFQPSCFTEFHFCVAGLSTCPSQRRNITSPASSWQSVNYTYRLLFGSKSAVYWCSLMLHHNYNGVSFVISMHLTASDILVMSWFGS